jgi:hypothetical protein
VVVVFFFCKSSQSRRAQARRIDVSDMTLSRPPDESLAIVCVCVYVFGSNSRDFVPLGGTLEGGGATCHGEVR